MIIGKLDDRVTIQAPTYTRSADGSVNITYTGSLTVWADVKQVQSSESIQAGKETVSKPIEVTVRYSTQTKDINEKYQLVYNGNSYQITSVITEDNEAVKINAAQIK